MESGRAGHAQGAACAKSPRGGLFAVLGGLGEGLRGRLCNGPSHQSGGDWEVTGWRQGHRGKCRGRGPGGSPQGSEHEGGGTYGLGDT